MGFNTQQITDACKGTESTGPCHPSAAAPFAERPPGTNGASMASTVKQTSIDLVHAWKNGALVKQQTKSNQAPTSTRRYAGPPCKRRTHLVGRSGCWLVVSGGVCGLVPVVCLAAGAVMQAHPAIGQTGAVDRADGGHGEVVQTNERVAACCESAAAVWCMKGAGSCTALGACVVTTTSTYRRR